MVFVVDVVVVVNVGDVVVVVVLEMVSASCYRDVWNFVGCLLLAGMLLIVRILLACLLGW